MAGNKYLIADRSEILHAKLDALSAKLQSSLESSEFQTQEAYLFEAVKILYFFYKSLNEPALQVDAVRADDYPDPSIYNTLWQTLLDDLISIFKELENIETLAVANFNFVGTEANRLVARLKSVSSKLGDYILYAVDASKDFLYFTDSFNDVSRIDVNSSLLNAEEGDINQAEGIATLPINKDKDPRIVIQEIPVVNPNSNGVAGNNQEIGATWNGDMSTILDSNPDTWFEYERVLVPSQDEGSILVLDITVNLGEERVINHIRINPNNFGTKTVIKVDSIDTSLDGQDYVSIKDDIPIAGFTTEDEENVFTLAPSTSKFAGQGIYTFTPRKVRYVHFVLTQEEPYLISTASGSRNRYAIGLRDIDIQALTYRSEGEVISKEFYTIDEIRKVILQTNQNPSIQSDLAEVRYYLSPDGGSTWNEISPENFSDGQYRVASPDGSTNVTVERIPELLEFNGASENTIVTSIPVTSLRLKAHLRRDDTAFEANNYTMPKQVVTASELHQVPRSAPFSFDLEYTPVNNTVVVVDPMYGSRGDPTSPYIIGFVQGGSRQIKYRLPLNDLPRPMVKEQVHGGGWYSVPEAAANWLHIEVNGEEWGHATAPVSSYTGGADKVFSLNLVDGTLEFGNGSTSAAPPEDSRIDLYFDAERLSPSGDEDNHIAKLDFLTSSNKDSFKIKRYGLDTSFVEDIPANKTVIHLAKSNVTDYSEVATLLTSYSYNEVDFVNGRDELTNYKDWSIDTEAGVIYLQSPLTWDITDASVFSYQYQPVYELTTDEWEWGTTHLLRDSIVIKNSAWATMPVQDSFPVSTGQKQAALSELSIVSGTLEMEALVGTDPVPEADDPFIKEVDFIDGKTELRGEASKTQQRVPALLGSQVNSFSLSENVMQSLDYPVVFSNTTVFATEDPTPSSPGQYNIDRGAGTVEVYVGSVPDDPGTVTYFYSNPNFSSEGLYSVDYAGGEIYTERPFNSSWTINANYEYTNFRAEYRIARLLDSSHYSVDLTNQKIFIKDEELFRRAMLPHKRPDGFPPQYLVNYDYVAETREDIQSLREFFSPVIKDYALKVLTKGKVF